MPAAALRPRSVTEIIDASFQLIRRHYRPLAAIAIAAYLPALVLMVVFVNQVPMLIAAYLLFFLAMVIADGAVLVAVSQSYLGHQIDVGAALRQALGNAVPLVLARIWQTLAMFVGFLLLIVGSVYMFARYFVMPHAIVLEEANVVNAAGRAATLSQNQKLRILGAMALAFMLFYVVSYGALFLATIAAVVLPEMVAMILLTVVFFITMALLYPVVGTVGTLLYYDLRIRTEAFDIEMLARELGAGEPAGLPRPAT